jgi:hypothetical protein
MDNKRLQEIKDSIDFQREILIAHNMNTLCLDEEQELYDYAINLQSKIDKAIDKLESLLPMCIMPNNMLIHETEKAKVIEETLDILKEDK